MDITTEVFGRGFKHRVAIYVPATTDVDKVLDKQTAKEIRNSVGQRLTEVFGGASSIQLTGFYQSNEGKLVLERTILVYAFCETLAREQLLQVRALALDLKEKLSQESIAIEVDNELFFV